jgi:hypothetical protein
MHKIRDQDRMRAGEPISAIARLSQVVARLEFLIGNQTVINSLILTSIQHCDFSSESATILFESRHGLVTTRRVPRVPLGERDLR